MELEVEPVEQLEDVADAAVPAGVDAPEYVLYGGKGGVGKTTLAAATALASARGGARTLVVSTDPAHSLSDTLETDIPDTPAPIHGELPLFGAEIDPETALEGRPDPGAPLAGLLGGAGDAATMPGADEAAAVWLLLEYLDDERFERVVVDTAPTGHTLRLLELPELLESLADQFSEVQDRLGGLAGVGVSGESAPESLGEFSARVTRLRELLQDPAQTDFRIVTVPEELSVAESERLRDRLAEFGIPVGTVVVNRVLQDPSAVADVDPDWLVAPNHADCEFCGRRWTVQRRALARAQELFREHDVRRVPLFAEEVRGEKLLRVVAACLEAD
ncbi:arsenic-transporting ATPase [Halobacteriales archaeon QH_10_67_13]|nr:MAG: arsenic-transporting ATPase [Halobacteriales archaeon QH_10_67_13]